MTFSSRPRRGVSRRRFLSLGMAGIASAFVADTAWYEPQALQVERIALASNSPGRQVRLLQISDLHLSGFNRYFAKVARQVADLQPDLIVLTGDYLEEERNIRGVLSFLKELKATHGIYAVQGNWEYWSRLEGENLRRHFAGVGVKLLINERADLEINGRALSIFGLDYPSATDYLHQLQREVDPQRFNLLLSHVPAFAHEQLNKYINLILSGHTHGGQVRLPFLPPLYLPRYSGRFVAGFYQVSQHRIPLYVSRGVGTSVMPLRLFCRPEITLFELGG
ncbi:MAG: metallophosphoesterase [Desulfuromonadales bacterium]|nr:metallophosphoesterase [Desulfuromonadales bacterium]